MELFLLIAGVSAAVVVGVAWALHKHDLAEGAETIGQWGVGAAVLLGGWEIWQEWNTWQHDFLFPKITFQNDGSTVREPPPQPPDFWRQVGHVGGQALGEAVRDIAISAVVFGVLFVAIRLAKGTSPRVE